MGTKRVATLISQVYESRGEDSTSNSLVSQSNIVDWLSWTLDFLSEAAISRKWKDLLVEHPISIVANQQSYDLPELCDTFMDLWFYTDSGDYSNHGVFLPFDNAFLYEDPGVRTYPNIQDLYRWKEGKIYLNFIPAANRSNGMKALFFRTIPNMHTGTLPSQSGMSTTQVTLPSSATLGEVSAVDDYYNQTQIYIVSGTGSGQKRTISDYTASTRLCTISSAWDTQPDITSTYEILCFLPEKYNELLIAGANIRWDEKDEIVPSRYEMKFNRLFSIFKRKIEKPPLAQGDHIRNVEFD